MNLQSMLGVVALSLLTVSALSDEPPAIGAKPEAIVIAHRGASGYLPEHTLAAKAMAYAQGADYIEQDLVMTKDDELVVLHDIHLDRVTDVADVYPGRQRPDGRFYAIDFTLVEIQNLRVLVRFKIKDGVATPVFPDRFPLGPALFRVPTFAEEIELIQGLNMAMDSVVGIYPEIKSPAFHRSEGKDISTAVLKLLKQYGYTGMSDKVFLQCFDSEETRRIHDELLPAMAMNIPLIQLMGTEVKYHWMLSADGMKKVAKYASGIGPSILLLIDPESNAADIRKTSLVDDAHDAGLLVHPYTFRRERDQMPPFSKNYDDFLRLFVDDIGVDGVFTDFPDMTRDFIESDR